MEDLKCSIGFSTAGFPPTKCFILVFGFSMVLQVVMPVETSSITLLGTEQKASPCFVWQDGVPLRGEAGSGTSPSLCAPPPCNSSSGLNWGQQAEGHGDAHFPCEKLVLGLLFVLFCLWLLLMISLGGLERVREGKQPQRSDSLEKGYDTVQPVLVLYKCIYAINSAS